MREENADTQLLYDQKWHRLAPRARIFRHVPFVDFVYGSGSLAIGNPDNESDFDVLIGVRNGRIFTIRFLAALFLSLRGWRRTKEHGGSAAADKVCLNHFVTPASYRLRLPINAYWQMLYAHLVPLHGAEEKLQAFLDANSDWAGERRVQASDLRYQGDTCSHLSRFLAWMLSGRFGDGIERLLKGYQVARIERGLRILNSERRLHTIQVFGAEKRETIHLPPLIVYSDEELEFHPDPATVEMQEGGAR